MLQGRVRVLGVKVFRGLGGVEKFWCLRVSGFSLRLESFNKD